MHLDYRSVIFTCSLLTFLVALLMGAYALTLRPRRPEIQAWAAAYALLIAGSILMVLRDVIPDFFSILLGNICLIGFLIAIRVGIFFIRGLKPRWPLVIAGLVLIVLWFGYFSLIAPSLPPRFYFYNCFIAVVALWSAGSIARRPEPGLAAVSRIAAAMLAVIGLSGIARIAFALCLGLPSDLMESANWDSIAQALQVAASCILGFSLISLRAESLNAELAAAVGDRELLVREMAHRTKNDLALVDSLISLEQDSLEAARSDCGGSAARQLDALRDRIRCMSEAHERLSLSEELGSVRLDGYLEAVAEGLPRRAGVAVERDFAAVEAPFTLAAPLGLVMNELAVNALKYAFPEGREGKIRLALRFAGDGAPGGAEYRLEVSDDGIGTKWPPERPGLGSMIVESFAKQIEGKLGYSFEGGSSFCLSFSLPRSDKGRSLPKP
jgi:two-component sensor histidine kinase